MSNGVNGARELVDRTHNGHGIANGKTNGAANGNGTRKKLDRKQSSPMMPAFMVSAPGKVIVFGEHAVVHGKVSNSPYEALRCIGSSSSSGENGIADVFCCGRPR
jgi:mevalonate kinase